MPAHSQASMLPSASGTLHCTQAPCTLCDSHWLHLCALSGLAKAGQVQSAPILPACASWSARRMTRTGQAYKTIPGRTCWCCPAVARQNAHLMSCLLLPKPSQPTSACCAGDDECAQGAVEAQPHRAPDGRADPGHVRAAVPDVRDRRDLLHHLDAPCWRFHVVPAASEHSSCGEADIHAGLCTKHDAHYKLLSCQ